MSKLLDPTPGDIVDMVLDTAKEEMKLYLQGQAELNRYVLFSGVGIASFCVLNLTNTKLVYFLFASVILSGFSSILMFIRMHFINYSAYCDASHMFLRVLAIQQKDYNVEASDKDKLHSIKEGEKADLFKGISTWLFYISCFFLAISFFSMLPMINERLEINSKAQPSKPAVELKVG